MGYNERRRSRQTDKRSAGRKAQERRRIASQGYQKLEGKG